jgi:hypothetical protein
MLLMVNGTQKQLRWLVLLPEKWQQGSQPIQPGFVPLTTE